MQEQTVAQANDLILYALQPKQKEFCLATTRYIAFGGARGGGKSVAVREKAKRLAARYAGINILIVRKQYVDLLKNHVEPLQREIGSNVAKYNSESKCFYFCNGSKINCQYFASDSDAMQYQGQEYDVIFLEEATQFGEQVFHVLKACLRGANKFPKRMYLTCNPGGVGHAWVKRLFIDRKFKLTELDADYKFIKSLLADNLVLEALDPEYRKNLESLPPAMRKAWLEGSWDLSEGAYFPEFNYDKHVIDIMAIEPTWRKYRVLDYGLDMLACYWVGVATDGKCYVYRELHEPNLTISSAATKILDLTGKDEYIYQTLAPSDLWSRSQETGKDKAQLFSESGLRLTKVSRDREAGWLALKELLKDDSTGTPRLQIFRTCHNLIEHIPELQSDPKRPTDCLTEPHDITHSTDAMRYFAIYWTTTPEPVVKYVKYSETRLEDWYNARSDEERAFIEEIMGGKPE